MANIVVRQDPFDLAFRDFFKNIMRPARWEVEPALDVRVDVKETDKAYKVHAELPGVKKEDIDISIDGNVVTLRAEVKREKEEKDEKMVRSERYYGAVTRSFSLDSDVDEKSATAKYSDGVLELVLPKKEGGRARHLKVECPRRGAALSAAAAATRAARRAAACSARRRIRASRGAPGRCRARDCRTRARRVRPN
jgi:HSP20 family protein